MASTTTASYQRDSWPVSLLHMGTGLLARVECAECGSKGEWKFGGGRPPAEVLPKHFSNKGWQMARKPVCPECIEKKRKAKMTANVSPIKTAAATKETDTVALRREANLHLQSYFNYETGQFDEGWSDEIIAKKFGLSPQWVTKHREENYGALKEPSELAEVRGQIDTLTSELGKLRAKLDGIARKGGWN